jgi:two-component system, NarL family, response regulator LiaR
MEQGCFAVDPQNQGLLLERNKEFDLRTPISILIVDDHEMVRNGIRTYLQTLPEFQVVGEASSGMEAIKLVGEWIPDVVLMDLIMPGMSGIETTREVKKISPRTQVVVLTSYHDDELIFPALRAGAISYILKDMRMDKLAEAIQRAARNEVTLHPLVAERVLRSTYNRSSSDLFYTDLTNRELDVLKLIGQGLNNNQIADQLIISEYTVRGHVSNILSKLHLADRTQAAVFAWQKGIISRQN